MTKLRVLRAGGSPFEIGYTHGAAYAGDIALLTEERLRLCTDPTWTGGRVASVDEVLRLGAACLERHEEYAPGLMDEMRGMAAATGLGLNELVIMNGFTDFVDVIANDRSAAALWPDGAARHAEQLQDEGDCTAFVGEGEAGAGGQTFIGQTWDMHITATPHVILLDLAPQGAPRLLTFTITGCVGMIGMNAYGVAVGINNIMGADGRIGVHWPYVVRQMLAQRTVDAALGVLLGARLSGGHNYVLAGPDAEGAIQGYNVEATATRCAVTRPDGFVAHSNHCLAPDLLALERPRKSLSLTSSCNRLDQAQRFLAERRGRIGVETLMEMTRHHEGAEMSICAHAHPAYDVESSGACIMAPATRELWALWGLPCANEYERFVVGASEAQPA